jgi:hypothetical protein
MEKKLCDGWSELGTLCDGWSELGTLCDGWSEVGIQAPILFFFVSGKVITHNGTRNFNILTPLTRNFFNRMLFNLLAPEFDI